jgi:mRNA (guanine-N7-)-methyltransferase
LKPGGFFIGTIPSAGWIMEKLRKSEGTSFGNDIYNISFEERDLAPPRFGAKYKFFLQDAVDDVPEYLVHTDTLVQLVKQYGMEFVMSETLWNFYLANKDAQADLLRRMKVHDYQGNLQMSDAGKELSGLYKVFVFRKRGNPDELRAMDLRGGRIDYTYRQYIPPMLEDADILIPPPPATLEAPTAASSSSSSAAPQE